LAGAGSSNKGRSFSEITKQRMSEARLNYYKYNKHPRLGAKYTVSDETKRKLSIAAKKDWAVRRQKGDN
jgi:hypothetical protein